MYSSLIFLTLGILKLLSFERIQGVAFGDPCAIYVQEQAHHFRADFLLSQMKKTCEAA